MKNIKSFSSIQLVPFLLLFFLTIFPNPTLSKSKTSQPFEFLQHLKGCHKGKTVKGLHELKQYLKKFGYVNIDSNHTQHANDDVFDDVLESEIRTYQLNYHLKPTGKLDARTVKQMMMPRCGDPDIVNGTTSMRSGKKILKHNHGDAVSVEDFAFFPGNLKWSKTRLTYRFSSSSNPAIPIDIQTLRSVCSQAFAKWASVTNFNFIEATGNQADIVIGFHRRDHGDGFSFDGRGGVLAHAFAPSDGRFHYDADENWSTNPRRNEVDLESLALHEIGHVLGLYHSSDPNAIMYPTFSSGITKRQLNGDDVQGIRALYGL